MNCEICKEQSGRMILPLRPVAGEMPLAEGAKNCCCNMASRTLDLPGAGAPVRTEAATPSAEDLAPSRMFDEVLKDDDEHVPVHDGESDGEGDIHLRGHTRASEQRNIGHWRTENGYIISRGCV